MRRLILIRVLPSTLHIIARMQCVEKCIFVTIFGAEDLLVFLARQRPNKKGYDTIEAGMKIVY